MPPPGSNTRPCCDACAELAGVSCQLPPVSRLLEDHVTALVLAAQAPYQEINP